ncbi:sugar ABC transporter permease [Paenibacillus sp. PL2-23]|uniref:carbohydrate ABC transporter permease n=1 Tax=Paenibacillus sp. PL2-23 TaxID=2100729 RepID=UPI0030FB4ECB
MSSEKRSVRRNRLIAYSFLLPNIVGYLIFILIPVIFSFFLGFVDWNGFNPPKFIGFDNYIRLFSDDAFNISFWNTIWFTLLSVPIKLFLSLLIAVALNKGIRAVKWFRTAVFLPYISATIAVAVVWQLLFNPSKGPINSFLYSIGIENPPGWLTSTTWALPAVALVGIWQTIGYYMIIYLAGLQGIPKHLYEAADIDGAGAVTKFFKITIPSLSPVIFFTVVISMINTFKTFDLIYIMTLGGPGRSTNVLVYTIYDVAFKRFELGYAAAISYVLFAIIFIFTLLQFRLQKKWADN